MKRPTRVSDEGRRASDVINNHFVADPVACVGRWVAIQLSDGGSDNVLYDSRADAIRHQLHETQCAYIMIPPGGTSPVDMTRFLDIVRDLYSKGARLSDPDHDIVNTRWGRV